MKKILLIGAIISSIAFAHSSMMNKGNSTATTTNMSMASTTKNVTLTEAQQKELVSADLQPPQLGRHRGAVRYFP